MSPIPVAAALPKHIEGIIHAAWCAGRRGDESEWRFDIRFPSMAAGVVWSMVTNEPAFAIGDRVAVVAEPSGQVTQVLLIERPTAQAPLKVIEAAGPAGVDKVVLRRVDNELAKMAKPLLNDTPKEHRCSLCNGPARPAYIGLLSHEPEQCLREGGCLATRDALVAVNGPLAKQNGVGTFARCGYETAFVVWLDGEHRGLFALRSDAVAAWRKATLDRAWGRK